MAVSSIKTFQFAKVPTLPTELEPNTLYAVKADGADTFRFHLTNNSGTIEASENSGAQGPPGQDGTGQGTVTSVAIEGVNGLEFTGSPITESGTFSGSIDAPTLRTHLNVLQQVVLTQAEYDALTPDPETVYYITG